MPIIFNRVFFRGFSGVDDASFKYTWPLSSLDMFSRNDFLALSDVAWRGANAVDYSYCTKYAVQNFSVSIDPFNWKSPRFFADAVSCGGQFQWDVVHKVFQPGGGVTSCHKLSQN